MSEKILELQKKNVLVNNFGTFGQIQLILATLDQKLVELTHDASN